MKQADKTICMLATDCNLLFHLTTRTARPNCAEFRVHLEDRAIKDLLRVRLYYVRFIVEQSWQMQSQSAWNQISRDPLSKAVITS